MVLGSHCPLTANFPPTLTPLFNWAFDGDLGVRIFFVISGLLITWLMLVEHDKAGRVNLSNFYARRALRILPVYIVFLCALAWLQFTTPFSQTGNMWIRNLTFTTNFALDGNWTSGHLWSLAVEEQFYILWPALFLLFGVAEKTRIPLWVFIAPMLIAPIARVITYLHPSSPLIGKVFTSYSFLNYFDSIALGCVCAVLMARRRVAVRSWLTTRPLVVCLFALLMVIIPFTLSRFLMWGVVTVPFGPTLQGAGIAILIGQSLMLPQFGFYSSLNRPLLCRIGVLSYSIYIWQELFCTKPEVFGLEQVWWMSFPMWLAPTFVAALLSYYGFELPFSRIRARFRKTY